VVSKQSATVKGSLSEGYAKPHVAGSSSERYRRPQVARSLSEWYAMPHVAGTLSEWFENDRMVGRRWSESADQQLLESAAMTGAKSPSFSLEWCSSKEETDDSVCADEDLVSTSEDPAPVADAEVAVVAAVDGELQVPSAADWDKAVSRVFASVFGACFR